MRLLILAVTVLLLALPAQAASLTLGKPGYGGPGCPGGSASVSLSRDGKSLTLRFTRYAVSAGGATGRTFDRKSCNLAIPVRVPAGKSVSILAIDFRGYNSLPASAKSEFRVEYFIAGGQGPVLTRSFNGPWQGTFKTSDQLKASSVVWSACGAGVTLRTNSSLKVTSSGGRAASASIEFAEGEVGNRLHPATARLLKRDQERPLALFRFNRPASPT